MIRSYGDKLGFIDIQYQYTIIAAALAAGGSITNIEPGKKLLLEVRKAGARIYPTNEAFAQGLKTEEFGIGVMWKARTVQWQNAGIPVKSVAPTEGALAYVSGFVIPKNAPNKDGAYAYLDAMMESGAQENFAIDMGYNPTVTNAKVARRPQPAHRLHARGDQQARRPRLRLHDRERCRDEGLVGQDLQGMMREALRHYSASRGATSGERVAAHHGCARPDRRGSAATALIGPATLIVALGLDHSDGDPVPLQPEPVQARPDDGRRTHARELRQVLLRPLLSQGLLDHACGSR